MTVPETMDLVHVEAFQVENFVQHLSSSLKFPEISEKGNIKKQKINTRITLNGKYNDMQGNSLINAKICICRESKAKSPLQQLLLQLTIHQRTEQRLEEVSLHEHLASFWSRISCCNSKYWLQHPICKASRLSSINL